MLGPETGPIEPRGGWRFVILAEIVNLSALRRHIGRPRAAVVCDDVVRRIMATLPHATVQCAARQLIEIDADGRAPADVHALLDRLQDAFRVPIDLGGELHLVDLLFAAAAGPAGAIEEVRLIEEAEDALAQAQVERRRVVRNAVPGMAADRLSLRRDLQRAIGRRELFLQYQPKVHVRRQEVTSIEALVRWNHPARGLILPGDFIPLAESSQMIGALTLWTLDQVIGDYHQLRGDGHDLTIFINISGQLLSDVQFIDSACQKIAAGGARIGFEVTETSVIRDPDMAISHLKRIAGQGVPIAIDDYGAGLSSLAYLKKLPATELKIDKMFVMELTSSHRDPLIVRSTIDLAHAMEMEVTAEGVETPAALALLSVMGCDMVQGFLLSRPVGLAALRRYLDEQAPALKTASFRGLDLRRRA